MRRVSQIFNAGQLAELRWQRFTSRKPRLAPKRLVLSLSAVCDSGAFAVAASTPGGSALYRWVARNQMLRLRCLPSHVVGCKSLDATLRRDLHHSGGSMYGCVEQGTASKVRRVRLPGALLLGAQIQHREDSCRAVRKIREQMEIRTTSSNVPKLVYPVGYAEAPIGPKTVFSQELAGSNRPNPPELAT